MSDHRFPFGAPVRPCGTHLPAHADTVILGAYPSALHQMSGRVPRPFRAGVNPVPVYLG